jgi:(p)ppGpp synthase/HD superfamily hydrolase
MKHIMPDDVMFKLKCTELAPFIQRAYRLINKPRRHQSNAFRHQGATLFILIDYGITDSIILKASVIHDLIEDTDDFQDEEILKLHEGYEVLQLVKEVSKSVNETKNEFLNRILETGSDKAKILKCADRISNLIDIGFCSKSKAVDKIIKETKEYILPIAKQINNFMLIELEDLVKTRIEIFKKLSILETIEENKLL